MDDVLSREGYLVAHANDMISFEIPFIALLQFRL